MGFENKVMKKTFFKNKKGDKVQLVQVLHFCDIQGQDELPVLYF